MYVQFISDDHFKNCVRHVLNAYDNAITLKESIAISIERGEEEKMDSCISENVW